MKNKILTFVLHNCDEEVYDAARNTLGNMGEEHIMQSILEGTHRFPWMDSEEDTSKVLTYVEGIIQANEQAVADRVAELAAAAAYAAANPDPGPDGTEEEAEE